jgi:hypothetical protein
LKNLDIEQDHFAANVETGLKPILSGYDVREVPISWINRTIDMGSSSFKIVKIAPNYFVEFLSIVWNTWRGRRSFVQTKSAKIAVLEKPASESPANRSVG